MEMSFSFSIVVVDDPIDSSAKFPISANGNGKDLCLQYLGFVFYASAVMDNVRDIAKAALDERMLCLKGLEAGNAGFTMPSMDVRVLPNPNMGEEENDVAVRPSCPRNHDVHNGAGKSFVTSESLFSNQVNLDFAGTRPRHTHSVATHEMGKHEVVWSAMTCEQHQDVMDAIFTKWKVLMAENPSELNDKTVGNTAEVTTNDDTTHMDNSLIIQSVIIQDQHRSYVGAAGGSKPEPNKSKENFHCCGILCTKQLGQIWFNSNNDELQGFLFFQFKTSKGLEDVLENGPWMIRNNPIILNKWTMNTFMPLNVNLVRSMWLFKHKFHADGTLSRYKARLVANGSSQQPGVDFDETFSLVVKPATIRTVLSLDVSRRWPIHQLDVKNAFLNCDLSETTLCIKFDMTDLGALNLFLGISAVRHSTGLFLSQKKYALQLLEHAHMPGQEDFNLTFTRPDLSYAVQQVCLYMHDPREPHFAALKRIMRYVQGTSGSRSSLMLPLFSNNL
ncbi:ribonuclease H-like domain-containing protein [Tanacetum coccineum]